MNMRVGRQSGIESVKRHNNNRKCENKLFTLTKRALAQIKANMPSVRCFGIARTDLCHDWTIACHISDGHRLNLKEHKVSFDFAQFLHLQNKKNSVSENEKLFPGIKCNEIIVARVKISRFLYLNLFGNFYCERQFAITNKS